MPNDPLRNNIDALIVAVLKRKKNSEAVHATVNLKKRESSRKILRDLRQTDCRSVTAGERNRLKAITAVRNCRAPGGNFSLRTISRFRLCPFCAPWPAIASHRSACSRCFPPWTIHREYHGTIIRRQFPKVLWDYVANLKRFREYGRFDRPKIVSTPMPLIAVLAVVPGQGSSEWWEFISRQNPPPLDYGLLSYIVDLKSSLQVKMPPPPCSIKTKGKEK